MAIYCYFFSCFVCEETKKHNEIFVNIVTRREIFQFFAPVILIVIFARNVEI